MSDAWHDIMLHVMNDEKREDRTDLIVTDKITNRTDSLNLLYLGLCKGRTDQRLGLFIKD